MTKKTTYKADFLKAQKHADEVLRYHNIKELPVKVKKIAKSFPDLKVRTYSWFAKKRGYSHEEVCELLDSEEGCCLYFASFDEYLILYNEKISNKGRKRWTLAHELGHYILNHNKRTNKSSLARSSLTDREYAEFESEANCFARELLAPPPVLNELDIKSPSSISNICDISSAASVNVYKFLEKGAQLGIKYPSHHPVLQLFSPFINKLKNTLSCTDCNISVSDANANYCPLCWIELVKDLLLIPDGNSKETLFENSHKSHKSVEECPACYNPEIKEKANYCKLCGSYLFNKCSGFKVNEIDYKQNIKWHTHVGGCGEFLDNNSRFCHVCGSTSTFLENGVVTISKKLSKTFH